MLLPPSLLSGTIKGIIIRYLIASCLECLHLGLPHSADLRRNIANISAQSAFELPCGCIRSFQLQVSQRVGAQRESVR